MVFKQRTNSGLPNFFCSRYLSPGIIISLYSLPPQLKDIGEKTGYYSKCYVLETLVSNNLLLIRLCANAWPLHGENNKKKSVVMGEQFRLISFIPFDDGIAYFFLS